MPPLNTFTRSCLALAIGQSVAAPAQAASIVVNDTGDTEQMDKLCTLREAITAANTNSSTDPDLGLESGCTAGLGIDTITFNSAVLAAGHIYVTQASLLEIKEALYIEGPASGTITIDGRSNAGVFDITDTIVNMSNLKITGGNTTGNGGGILVDNSLITISGSTVSGNMAAGNGGGIYALDSGINLLDSIVSGNSASFSGGGLTGGGGIQLYDSSINLVNSTVSGNSSASRGGAIGAVLSGMYLLNCSVSGNSAYFGGGGISAFYSTSVILSSSTVSGNVSHRGGGILTSNVSVTLVNSTVSENTSTGNGGGIAIYSNSLSLSNSTVSANSAATNGGGIFAINSTTTAGLRNSIVAGNDATGGAEIHSSGSTFVVNSANLLGDNSHTNSQAFYSSPPGFAPGPKDIDGSKNTFSVGIPLAQILEPLDSNGGPTRTHALVVDSPAIDRGNNAGCPTTDQRGRKRNDGKCDIGAYEFMDESSFFVVPLPNGKTVIFGL